jgi:hypothetical protein
MDDSAALREPRGTDAAMAFGAVALGAATAVAYQRMADGWAAFPLFLLVLVPCVALFAIALSPGPTGGRWQSATLAVAHLLLIGALANLVRVLGDDDPGSATITWTFAAAGISALFFSERLDSAGLRLLGLLVLGGAALALVDWIDSTASAAAYRDVLLVEGIGFLFLARVLGVSQREHAHVAVTAAALALIAGGAIGIFGEVGFGYFLGFDGGDSPSGENGWELVVLAVSLGALAYSGWQRYRGTVYPGLAGLVVFFSVADQGSLAGWPLILLAVAVACMCWAIYGTRGSSAENRRP